MTKHDGGPAFPTPEYSNNLYAGPDDRAERVQIGVSGCLSIRDFFAAHALAGLVVGNDARVLEAPPPNPEMWSALHAKAAYQLADAMLVERNKGE